MRADKHPCEINYEKKIVHTKCYWLVQKDLADDSIGENGYSESSMYGD